MSKFEQEKKKVERWLIKVIKQKQELLYLAGCNEDLKLCGCDESVHIYKGIEKLAFYLGLTLTYEPSWYGDNGRITADYNGVFIYQIWKKGAVQDVQ